MGVVGRLDQYGSMLTSEFDEITANNPSVTGLGTYYSSEFNENIVDIVRDGLVLNLDAANLSSYPGSGTTWTDVSGGGNTGTLTNGPTYSSANGGSIVFDGTNDYAEITDSSNNFDLGGIDATLEFWIYMPSTSGGDVIITKGGNTANWVLTDGFIYAFSYDNTNNRFSFNYNNGGGAAGVTVIGAGSQPINNWYHVVVVTNTSNDIRFYVNTTNIVSATNAISKPTTRTRFRIGTDLSGNYTNARIPVVRIYKNKALSAAEVTQNYNALKNRFEILTPSSVTSGLVLNLDAGNPASYPGSGTTWTNLLGTGNNGTLVNGPTYNTANGGSLVFDGTNDYTQLTSQNLISVDFSVEVWFYATKAVSSQQVLFTSYNLPGGAQSNTFILYISGSKVLVGNGLANLTGPTITTNTWYHAIATYTSSTSTLTLYINGTSQGSAVQSITASASSNFIGGSPGDNNLGTSWFGGSIPVVKVYRTRALSAAEVLQNYNSTIERFLTPLTSNFFMRQNRDKSVIVYNEIDEIADIRDIVRSGLVFDLDAGMNTSYPGFGTTWNDISSPPISAATGALPIYNTTDIYGATKGTGTRTDANASSLVLAVPMDGANNGTTFTDESATIRGSGTAKTITVNGNTKTLTAVSKFYGSSGFFDGTGDWLTTQTSSDFDLSSGDWTIEFWVYPLSNLQNTFLSLNAGSNGGINFWREASTGRIYIDNGAVPTTASTATMALNAWHHLAAVRVSGTTTVYLNGTSIITNAFSPIASDRVSIGVYNPSSPSFALNGYLQDVRIYKGVAKYTANFTPPGNPTNSIGTLTNGPTYSATNGGSIVFDGVDDFVNTPNSASLLAVGNGSFTFASWFKLSGTKTWAQNLIRRDNFLVQGGENRRIIAMSITANTNFVSFGIYDGGGNNAIGSQNLSDGLWHYVVGVRESSTGTNYVYVDGVLKAQAVYNNTQPFNTSNASYAIGNVSSNYTAEPFFGNIAQAQIYNRALSAAEILQNYNALRNRYGL